MRENFSRPLPIKVLDGIQCETYCIAHGIPSAYIHSIVPMFLWCMAVVNFAGEGRAIPCQ